MSTKGYQDHYRTIGEVIYKDQKFSLAKRNKAGSYQNTISREEIVDELKQLFTQQRTLGNIFTRSDFENRVNELLMLRKPALSGQDLIKMIGNCTFERLEKRAPKACYSAERFVWLTKLNNLRLSFHGEMKALTEEERNKLLEEPFLKSKLKYERVRKILALSDNVKFNGLSYRFTSDGKEKNPEDAVLFEAKYFHELQKAYKKANSLQEWQHDAVNVDRLDDIGRILTCYKEDDERVKELGKLGIENKIIQELLRLSYDKFIRLSQKALKKIIPLMERGLRYDEAIAEIPDYQHHSQINKSQEKSNYLPPFNKDEITNPVVARAVNQARKLVNAIIKKYGQPASVHIELSRDLAKSKKERDEITRGQKTFGEEKEKAVKEFEETFHTKPKGQELQKYLLYREQDCKCAYSLRAIDLSRLLENNYVEIDHILPFSRSYDDSKNNKALVLTHENRNKGNRTPYEYLDGTSENEHWRLFEASVHGNKKTRKAKRDRLLRKNFSKEEAEGFRERHLFDTRYICKLFKNHIEKHLNLEDKQCVVVSGGLTAFLRSRWGLLKVRDDGDLHHALDAAVIAACNRSMIKRLADYSRGNEIQQLREIQQGNYADPETGEIMDRDALQKLQQLEKHFPQPWSYFREELMARLSPNPAQGLINIPVYGEEQARTIQPVRVSRMPTRRGTGAAHKETIRSIGGKSRYLLTQDKNNPQSAVRTPLEKLKLTSLEDIVGYDDPRNKMLIEAIRQRLKEHGSDGKKAFGPNKPLYHPSYPPEKAPIVRTIKLKETQKSGLEVRGGIADNDSILRIDIFTKNNKFYVVPIYVSGVVRDGLPNKAATAVKPESEWTVMDDTYTFLFSLYKNDWVQIKTKKQLREGYYCEFDRATAAISIYIHDRNSSVGKKGEKGKIRGIGIKTAINIEKYHVDILGQLYKVKQEIRAPLRKTKPLGKTKPLSPVKIKETVDYELA